MIGKGNATYYGGAEDCAENEFILPPSHFGGKIIGDKSSVATIKNVLNVTKVSQPVIFKNNRLEGTKTDTTTSDITHYIGRPFLPESVECFDMTLKNVDAQGSQYGKLDKIIACKTVILSGFEDIESHTDDEKYEFLIKKNAKGFSSIVLPNAKEILIKFSDI
ncbi:MAG: hypothetical protein O7C59_06205 [Rickettsia endosymbiont of Ixodes persulcatus]|nr:hypothetical protein [Rickettsia endosymbiont of Ixodes persulcatus]